MTASTATSEALDWADLAPLPSLLEDVDGEIRAAAAEAAARLPLSPSAWDRVAPVLSELLDTEPSLGVAQAAAHAPLGSLRQQLRAIAADGGHPGQHVASVALSEVGDDSVLAADVARLLARPLTDHTALQLIGLPLERLALSPDRIPEVRTARGSGLRSLSTAVAAARLGDTSRLDRLLRKAAGDPSVLLVPWWTDAPLLLATAESLRQAMRAALPLPAELVDHLDRQLATDAEAHQVLRSVWLAPAQPQVAPDRLDEFIGPLAQSFDGPIVSAEAAGLMLADEAIALTSAPDPRAVYAAWLRVAGPAQKAWPHVAWILGRAGGRVLVDRLSPWLDDPGSALSACRAVRDAATWLTTPLPPGRPNVVMKDTTWVDGPPSFAPPGGPDEDLDSLIDDEEPAGSGSAGSDQDGDAPRPDFDPDLDFGVGFEPEGLAPPSPPPPPPPRPSGAAPTAGDTAQPHAPAYAKLSCPSAVVVETEFDLELGLGPRPTRGVTAQPLTLPDRAIYPLTVQLVVDGFTLRAGEEPTVELAVTAATPYPTANLHLTARSDPEFGALRSILAVFSVDGRTVGSATRAVEVVPTPDALPRDAVDAPPTGVDTALPSDAQTADLTVTISKGDDLDGRRLLWSFQSPHASVPGSAEPLSCTLGARPEDFARSLMRTAGRLQGESLKAELTGAGKVIARLLPGGVHDALRATAAAVGGPPSVLLLSADPYVPWELARIEPPWLPDIAPMLGAQAAVGRWALREPGPTPEPPRSVSVRDMTIVRGVYERVIGFNQLKHAEQEALDLQAAYGATVVDAAQEPFFATLRGEPSAEILHFAMHGKFDPMGLQDGLILVDGNVIDPLMILGADLSRHPFVFLNACQVGQADETLGQYGGMAQSFVEAGASAVIAPLWVVKDDVARDVSLRFYASAFAGTTAAEFLRAERARDGSGTHLAYVLYGHPLLQLTRSKEADGDGDPAGP